MAPARVAVVGRRAVVASRSKSSASSSRHAAAPCRTARPGCPASTFSTAEAPPLRLLDVAFAAQLGQRRCTSITSASWAEGIDGLADELLGALRLAALPDRGPSSCCIRPASDVAPISSAPRRHGSWPPRRCHASVIEPRTRATHAAAERLRSLRERGAAAAQSRRGRLEARCTAATSSREAHRPAYSGRSRARAYIARRSRSPPPVTRQGRASDRRRPARRTATRAPRSSAALARRPRSGCSRSHSWARALALDRLSALATDGSPSSDAA